MCVIVNWKENDYNGFKNIFLEGEKNEECGFVFSFSVLILIWAT